MTTEDYESRTDSVLAWKKAQKLGRFDPNAPEIEKAKIEASFKEVEDRGAWFAIEKFVFRLPRNLIKAPCIAMLTIEPDQQASSKASAAASSPQTTTAAASSPSSAKSQTSQASVPGSA
jgi:hypothetical protein